MAASNQLTDRSWRTPDTDSIEADRVTDSDRSGADYRLENARLRLQIALLERELERDAQNRQAVIDHYEALLSEREAELTAERSRSEGDWTSRLRRILEIAGL